MFPLIFLALCWPVQSVLVHGLARCRNGNVGTLNQVVRGGIDAQVLISGSSRAVYHFDPRIIARLSGKSVFNIGRDGTKLDEQLALLKTYLRHNRKPEYIIQNLDGFSLRANDGVTDPMQYMGSLNEPELYENVVSHRRYFILYKYFPLVGFIREGAVKPAVESLLNISSSDDNRIQGYLPQNRTWTDEFEKFKQQHPMGVEWPIEPQGQSALREMLQLCQDSNIPIILVYSPEYVESQNLTRNRAEIFASFHAIASTFNMSIWDYSQDAISMDRDYFYNSQHMNEKGASLFSDKIGRRLSEYFSESVQK